MVHLAFPAINRTNGQQVPSHSMTYFRREMNSTFRSAALVNTAKIQHRFLVVILALTSLRIYRHEEQSTTKVLTNKKTEDAANEGAAIEREKR